MFIITLDEIFHNYFKDSFIEDVICEKVSSVESETGKTTFTVWKFFEYVSPVFIIPLQPSLFDIDNGQAKNNKYKIAIPSEFFIKIPSPKEKI